MPRRLHAAALATALTVVLVVTGGEPASSSPVGSPVCSAPGADEQTVIRTATNSRAATGWAGADTAGSLRLADGRVLWLYGDTWVGSVAADGTRVTEAFVSNSVGVQHGSCVEFLVSGGPGAWSPFFAADADPTTHWWPAAAVEHRGRIYVGYGAWGPPNGQIVGDYRGSVIAELDPATLAVVAVHPTPWFGERHWGVGFAADGDDLHVYGVDHLRPGTRWWVARWDGAAAWTFLDATGAPTPDQAAAAPLLGGIVHDGMPQVFPWLGGTAVLTTEGLFVDLTVRLWWSPTPAGPFQDLGVVGAIPNDTEVPSPYRYLGATLPTRDGRLLLAWNVNSFDWQVLDRLGRAELIRYQTLTLPPVGTAVAPPTPGEIPAAQSTGLPGGAGAFVALPPARLLDTRETAGTLGAGGQVDLTVLGRAGVPPAGVEAVALNVTGVDAAAAGFVTAWPTGRTRPTASVLNLEPADTRANLVIVAPGAGGAVSLFSLAGADLVVDVAGYWAATDRAVSAGRFQALAPSRVLDTRLGIGTPAGSRPAGSTVSLPLAGRGGVPSIGASAVAVSLTATETQQDGFVTAYPSGSARPLASNLNLGAAGTRANLVLVPLGPDGSISLYTHAGGHLVADVVGWFTGPTAAPATAGLFVPLPAPVRHLDSRTGFGGMARIGSGETRQLRIGGQGWVPPGASAVATNLTVVESRLPGFVTAWPSGQAWPTASNANMEWPGQIVPVATATRLGGGSMSVLASASSHLVVDVAGWFL